MKLAVPDTLSRKSVKPTLCHRTKMRAIELAVTAFALSAVQLSVFIRTTYITCYQKVRPSIIVLVSSEEVLDLYTYKDSFQKTILINTKGKVGGVHTTKRVQV